MKLLLALVLLATLAPAAHAVSIGASPGSLHASGVLAGGYAQTSFYVSTDTDDTLFGSLIVAGDAAEWVSFADGGRFNTTRNNPRQVTVIVQPPQDVPAGTYEARITVSSDTVGSLSGRAGSAVQGAVILPLEITITGEQSPACSAGGAEVKNIEEQRPLEMWLSVSNTGNVRLSPQIDVVVWDVQDAREPARFTLQSPVVLPTVTSRFFLTPAHELELGQYWANVSVPDCEFSGTYTFSIDEKGAIADRGELLEVGAPAEVLVGDQVPIIALFANRGERVVSAQFKGTVRLGERTIATVESEQIDVAAGESERLSAFFSPEEQGTYTVSGRVHYNRKITFERSDTFTAYSSLAKKTSFVPIIIYAALVITILFFIRKIRQKRR